jgi:hypothetical protein
MMDRMWYQVTIHFHSGNYRTDGSTQVQRVHDYASRYGVDILAQTKPDRVSEVRIRTFDADDNSTVVIF